MRLTKEGLALIKSFEGCRLTAYYDGGIDEQGTPQGKLTIGWGHIRGVFAGDQCSQETADAWLLEDLAGLESGITQVCHPARLNDNQLSALVSFVFNVGYGARGRKDGFLELKSGEPSSLLLCIRRGDYAAAAQEFPKWDKVGGAPSAGVFRRRLAEKDLFEKEPNPWKRLIKGLKPASLFSPKSKLS